MDLKSGYPFWLIKNGLPFDYPVLLENTSSDVLIMGGGISGALMAYHLMESGIPCMLIDGRAIGLGSTCASTSLLQYEIDVPLCELKQKIGLKNAVKAYKLCEEAIDSLKEIAYKIEFKEFQEKQSLYYAASKKDDAFIREEYQVRQENGFDVRLLDAKEIQGVFHFRGTTGILSAKAAQTNAYNFTHALHQYNIKRGLRIFDRTEAIKIKHSVTGVELETNRGHMIKCRKLIYATGYEAVNYVDRKIVQLQSTYAICSEQMQQDEIQMNGSTLLWNTADPYLYLRTTTDNRIIIGGRDEKFYDPGKRDILLPKKSKQLEADLKKLFPGSVFKTEFSWAGTFGATKDGLPFIGEYKKLPNSYFALGFGGNGIVFSMIAAAFLTNTINGKQNPGEEMFSFNRI
ncbi:MAG: FAD-dependent oxidoreductase [Ferruginibacter sp.]